MQNSTTTIPWIEKYRPSYVNEIVDHDFLIGLIQNFVKERHFLPNLFFYGASGTGKTSLIHSICKDLYQDHFHQMVLHINASDEKGLDNVLKHMLQFASSVPLYLTSYSKKVIILDEVDMLPEHTQLEVLNLIDLYEKHVSICLIGNYQYKLIPELHQYFLKFLFSPLLYENIKPVIHRICEKEGIVLTETVQRTIYEYSNGDLRKYINVLQSLSIDKTQEISVERIESFFPIKIESKISFLFHKFNDILRNDKITNKIGKSKYWLQFVMDSLRTEHFSSLVENTMCHLLSIFPLSPKQINVQNLVKDSVNLLINSSTNLDLDISKFYLVSICLEYLTAL